MITLKAIRALKNCEDLSLNSHFGYHINIWYRPELFNSMVDCSPMFYQVTKTSLGEVERKHCNTPEEAWATFKKHKNE